MELKKHQLEALEFLKDRDGAALHYEMGLGKTVIMLQHLLRMKIDYNKDPFPCLIVCPLSAVSVWKRESDKFGFGFKFEELTGDRSDRVNALNRKADIYVINYEGLRILKLHLLQKGFRTIIFDESHRVKERSAEQTKIALMLSQRIQYRYNLTGTPVSKSPEDIWTQSEIVAPGRLDNFYVFRARHIDFRSIMVRVHGALREVKKAVRFKNLEELNRKTSEFSLRRTKKECIDLPEKIYKFVPCQMTAEQEKHYHGLRHSLATMIDDKQFKLASMAAVIRKLQQVCQGFIYGEDGKAKFFDNAKLKILKDILEDISNEKAIVFTWFQADIELLETELAKTRKVIVYGGSSEERAAQESLFQNSEEPCIFLANIEVAKESITLTSAAHVIYYANSWNYASRCQSEDRAHRIGQKRNVVYHDLVCPGTVDEMVYDALKKKGDLADKVTGDTMRMAQMILGLEAA